MFLSLLPAWFHLLLRPQQRHRNPSDPEVLPRQQPKLLLLDPQHPLKQMPLQEQPTSQLITLLLLVHLRSEG